MPSLNSIAPSRPVAPAIAPVARPRRRKPPQWSIAVITALFERGAHFVFAHDDKSPMWRAYTKLRPTLREVLEFTDRDSPMYAKGRLLGILPASLGYSVLDVDKGDITRLLARSTYAACLPSRLKNRWHVWYRDSMGRRRTNGDFEGLGCKGEVRAAQNLILWHSNADHVLAMVIADPYSKFPDDILAFQKQLPKFKKSMKPRAPTREGRYYPDKQKVVLDDITPGVRNGRFFQRLASIAHCTQRGHSQELWFRFIEETAIKEWYSMSVTNRETPGSDGRPFGLDEVKGIAKSVAMESWVRDISYDSDSQSFRREIGVEKYQEKHDQLYRRVEQFRAKGLSVTQIAAKEEIGKRRIQQVLQKGTGGGRGERIRLLHAEGLSSLEIANQEGITKRQVNRYLSGAR